MATGTLAAEKFEGASSVVMREVNALYTQGKFQRAYDALSELVDSQETSEVKGIARFWQALCLKKLLRYPAARDHFQQARALGYRSPDFSYEFAQTLYALEDWPDASLEFMASVDAGFKKAVSLYYLATIALNRKRYGEAVDHLGNVFELTDAQSQLVHQPAAVLLGDVYLARAQLLVDRRDQIADIVVPQYRRALALDDRSELAPLLREKIKKVRQENRLAIFELVNGRPTAEPRHVLRLTSEVGLDSNVTFSPANTTVSKSKQQSTYGRIDVLARYSFYYRNYLSFAPGLRFNQTRYFNRQPEIFRNDNQLHSPTLNLAHEHKLWQKPAATLLDYDYSDVRRDVNSRERLEFSARTHALGLGERFMPFAKGETTVRARFRKMESYQTASDSTTLSLSAEQVLPLASHMLVLLTSYDRTRVVDASFDTDALLLRADYFAPSIRGWVTPSVALAVSLTDPINARTARGRETLLNPSFRLSNSPAQGWRLALKADYQQYVSEDKDNFAYTKSLWGMEMDYMF